MKSPYKVHFARNSGWRFTVPTGGKRRVFVGFETETQAAEAKRHVLSLISQSLPVPTGLELRRIFSATPSDRGGPVKVEAREVNKQQSVQERLERDLRLR